ncbi:hypothetical protein M011DRAFT_460999 [Sporormia fimetaria CBS 119925]|uniref:Uncharacterized protein n=1 Tax=Sporormia fimetaria CBS 119925 TaxID=1340428 RepID=A0A6A6V4E4_9PLEO|nr:hypothetical protein M011DRAFT_460999 [Sporormia fimetaria CBS 119925]
MDPEFDIQRVSLVVADVSSIDHVSHPTPPRAPPHCLNSRRQNRSSILPACRRTLAHSEHVKQNTPPSETSVSQGGCYAGAAGVRPDHSSLFAGSLESSASVPPCSPPQTRCHSMSKTNAPLTYTPSLAKVPPYLKRKEQIPERNEAETDSTMCSAFRGPASCFSFVPSPHSSQHRA